MAVNNWSTNFDGVSSVFDLRELYIPINKGGIHWFLLRIRVTEKSVEIWDSLGHNETNQVYLQLVCRYIYNIQNYGKQREQVTPEEWSLDWS